MAIKTYPKHSTEQLSANFQAREFDCTCSRCTETLIDEKLVKHLQKIRDYFQKPISPTAYRCPAHNAEVPNAATKSRHTMGMAADFHIDGVPPIEIARYAESIGIKGIGLYDNFVHIDSRDKKSFWYSHAQEYRSTFGGTPLEEDSSIVEFIKEVQSACGATVDGIAGPETMSMTVILSSNKNRKHEAVRAVQKRLKALGYVEVGDDDGVAGPKFTSAVAHFQQDRACEVDGIVGPQTWAELLEVKV